MANDIQVGVGYLHGIQGSITLTPTGGTDVAPNMNIETLSTSEQFTADEIVSQDGTIIEAVVATKRFRDLRVRFMPKGTTRANAETAIDTIRTAFTPLKVITIAACTVTDYNGTYNYTGGLSIEATREGRVVMEFNARQYETSTPNTFAGLAVVTG